MRRKENELHEFTVEGTGQFPFDMLRYDACWPKSEWPDSARLYHEPGTPSRRRRVTLQTHYLHAPTVARRESFTWRVLPFEAGDSKEGAEQAQTA